MGKVSMAGMKQFQKQLKKIQEQEAAAFVEACAKELAARLLAKVIKRTPVGNYSKEIEVTAKRDSKHHKKGDVYKKRVNPSGKLGGTLRRGWTSKTQEEAADGRGKQAPSAEAVKQFVDLLEIQHKGDQLRIELINPVCYASYVNYGHRTAHHKGWVEGNYMVEYSEQELQAIAPKVLEARLKEFLERYMV